MAGSRQEPPAAAAEKPKETGYIVLRARAGDSPEVLGLVQANGPEQAVRRKAGDVEGTFVAVPERNWTLVDQTSEVPPPIIRATTRKWGEGRPVPPNPETTEEPPEPDSRPPAAEPQDDEPVDVPEDEPTPEELAASIEDDGA